ncbi:DarT ssDNA thymidine ADP-ribosyltransferase family protein, partial [Frankia umida]|uniref:DarT ssDNA thymidine ADP-ribosyltransferase family protein n=1 Tax=Frankia umida TaxID=573489 RepID=UPI003557902F
MAYPNIKSQRAKALVEAGPGGNLDEYVPFYFGPRSPMLLAYTRGGVTGRTENPDHIVYFVTQAERVAAHGYQFAFTDGHPIRE